MFRRLVFVLAFALACAGGAAARAQSIPINQSTPGQVQQGGGTYADPYADDSQAISALLGVAMGGKTTPGGAAAEGRYLYRLSDIDWLETSVHFSLGAGGKECFRDRDSTFVCEHGLLDGFAAEGDVGLRRYFIGQDQYHPYVRAGIGMQLVSFADDDVIGVGIPLYLGAGLRVEVAYRVFVVADATARAGASLLNQNLGVEPNVSLSIASGVEFTLD